MKSWVALVALAVTACSQPAANPVARVSPTPAGVHVSPVLPGPAFTPTPAPTPGTTELPFDLPLSKVGFSCRLPIYRYGSNGVEDSFITFPAASVAADPTGIQGMYFDRAFSIWVPVPRSAVSPDGTHYAYIEIGQEPDIFVVHVVSIATGYSVPFKETASASGFGAQPQVFDYSAGGVYLTEAFEHVWPGVWLFNPTTGAISKVADIEVPEVSGGSGIIWFGRVNPADPNPLSTGTSAGILPDEVDRIDLKTGTRTQWLYRPGAGLVVMGLDVSGHPVITAFTGITPTAPKTSPIDPSATELLIAPDDHTQRSIFKGQLSETLTSPIADSHGVWFGSDQGIYLYSESAGLQKISNEPGIPANGCF